MIATIQISVLLLIVVAAAALAARRLMKPPAIVLVLVGAALALVPGLPRLELVPELVLLLVLPPLIYSAGVAMSWREFRFNLRPIGLLAVGCVLFTTVGVAAVGHALLGMPWAVGFVLGAIISPPDAVAPLAIARRLGMPRRLMVILEGEGLANDATALILYRFAVVAVSTGTFSLGPAVGTFLAIFVGEVAYGLFLGWLMLRARRAAHDSQVEITLSLVTPYLAFWVPAHLGGSGVIATVATGLYVSWNGPMMINSATRLQGFFFWDLLTYLIEGLVFLLTGLQARTLIDRIGTLAPLEIVASALLMSVVVIVARFVWMYPAIYLPRLLIPGVARRDPAPQWQGPFILAFTGIRGIVSLAAALALPFTTASGAPFPHRDLILFLTFGVIIVTLVGQGLMMPGVLRWLGLCDVAREERRIEEAEELASRRQTIETALRRLDEMTAERDLPADIVEPVRSFHLGRLHELDYRSGAGELDKQLARLANQLELQLIEAERTELNEMLRDGRVKDDARRRIERELDLREVRLRRSESGDGIG